MIAQETQDSTCQSCGATVKCTTSKLSQISWDVVLTGCQESLGITLNGTLSAAMNLITAAICALQAGGIPAITCSSMRITTDYANIGFSSTETSTLCDLLQSINNKFGTVLDFNFDEEAFETSPAITNIPDMIQAMIDKLTIDLYTTNSWLFLPLNGNTTSAFQQSYFMAFGSGIYWGAANNPYISGSTTGLSLKGGSNGTNENAIKMLSPEKVYFAPRPDYSVLTVASTTLAQDSMKPNYFFTKASVTSIYLPQLSTMNVENPIVTFSATIFDSATGAVSLYPALASGELINGIPGAADLTHVNTITLMADKANLNWRLVAMQTF